MSTRPAGHEACERLSGWERLDLGIEGLREICANYGGRYTNFSALSSWRGFRGEVPSLKYQRHEYGKIPVLTKGAFLKSLGQRGNCADFKAAPL